MLENLSRPSPARGVTGEATGSIARLVGALEILPHDPHPRQIDMTEHLVVDVSGLLASSPGFQESDFRIGPIAQIGVQAANVVENGADPVVFPERVVRLLTQPVLVERLGEVPLDVADYTEVLVDHRGQAFIPPGQRALEGSRCSDRRQPGGFHASAPRCPFRSPHAPGPKRRRGPLRPRVPPRSSPWMP